MEQDVCEAVSQEPRSSRRRKATTKYDSTPRDSKRRAAAKDVPTKLQQDSLETTASSNSATADVSKTDDMPKSSDGDCLLQVSPDSKSSQLQETGHSRLTFTFYDQDCEELAKNLLGKVLVMKGEDEELRGMVVETEAYLGGQDKAAHSYNGKRTARNEAMYMTPGTSYVYHIYGTYTCVNISSRGEGAAVLIRALEPCGGVDQMKKHRAGKRTDEGQGLKLTDLASGPSKLTQALGITKANGDQKNLSTCEHMWLEAGSDVGQQDVVVCARIGVDYAEEWAKKPLRFYIRGNKHVSKRDKEAEKD